MLKQKIFLILFGLTLILGVSELFLCLNPKFGYRYHSFRFKSKKLALDDMSYLRPSVLLGYELIPNFSAPNFHARVNSYGLIGREYKINKDKNIFRLLILADSIGLSEWPGRFLEENLNTNFFSKQNKNCEVWTLGVPSYDVRRYALYLKHKGLNYNPDMVIIFLFMNDFWLNTNIYYKTKNGTTEYHFPISEISKVYIPNPFLMKHSYLYRFIILRLDSFLMGKRKTQGVDLQEENGRYYLRIIKQICQKNNIPLFVVIFPYIKPLNEYEDWQMDDYLVICKVIKDLKISYYNLYDLYEQLLKENSPLRVTNEDDIHPSREASRLIARKISDYILENSLNKD